MGLLRYGSGLGAFADSLLKTYMSLEENERANASLKMKDAWQKAQMEEQQRQAALQEIQRQALMQNIEMAKAAEQRRVEEAQRANMARAAMSQTVPNVSSSRGMLTGELQPGQAPYRQMNPPEKLNALMPFLDPEKSATALTSISNTGEMANVRQSVAALKAQQDYERQMMRDAIERFKEEGRNKRDLTPNVTVNNTPQKEQRKSDETLAFEDYRAAGGKLNRSDWRIQQNKAIQGIKSDEKLRTEDPIKTRMRETLKGGNAGKTVKRRGTYKGRRVVEYTDGTTDYED